MNTVLSARKTISSGPFEFFHPACSTLSSKIRQFLFSCIIFDFVFIRTDFLTLQKHLDVSVFFVWCSNAARVNTGFCFKLQESINILYRKSTFARCWIVLCDLIFVNFMKFDYFVSLGNSQPEFFYEPGAFPSPFSIGELLTFFINVLVINT